MRPVHFHLVQFESLKNGAISLEDLLILNVSIDNNIHNEQVIRRSQNNGNRS